MYLPLQCHLWKKELTREDFNLKGNFLILHMFDQSNEHIYHRLLRCNDCDQLYFYEFFEDIDGKEDQLSTLIPIETESEAHRLDRMERSDLLKYMPRLHKDWPAEKGKTKIYWIKEC